MLSLLTDDKLRRVLARMLDPNEFLGDHGIRSLSKVHLENPYVFHSDGQDYRVGYLPAESDTGMFGGNSNWRGPIWAPINALLVRALLQMYAYYGDDVQGRVPDWLGAAHDAVSRWRRSCRTAWARSSSATTRAAVPSTAARRSSSTIRGGTTTCSSTSTSTATTAPGLGASHQTGWTAVIPAMMQLFAQLSPEKILHPDATLAEIARERDASRTRRGRIREAPAALPDQHPRLPPGARGCAGATRDAGGHPGRVPRRHRGKGVRLGLVPGRLADRPRRARDLAVEPEAGRGVPPRSPRSARAGHERLAVRDHGVPRARRLRRRRRAGAAARRG